MTSPDHDEAGLALSPQAADEMAKYGITRLPVDCFHYGDFRYTNLNDAVAQARRQQQPQNESRPTISLESSEELAKYGITRVPVDYFHYGKYRYTNQEDAVAEAARQHRTGCPQ